MSLSALLLTSTLALAQGISDEEAYVEGCIAGGDTEIICQCTIDHLRRSYIPSEYKLLLAMMVSGMTKDQERTAELVQLFSNDMQAFGKFASDGRVVLDKAFIGCRTEHEE